MAGSSTSLALAENLLSHIRALEGLGSRYYAREGNRAGRAYIEGCLEGYGYRVETSQSEFQGALYDSPWAIKAGKPGMEGALYLLTAHFDSISQDQDGGILADAPGADDNASGVAVLLEVARALAQLDLEHSVGFVFFNV
ncbi:MAG TPA: M28 family peptidase, partial [bacterium]|nr:M28 family peptidase [bacterium]